MKVGIVVPYSWSFWGAVIEHAELQAAALQRLGVETRTIIGNDPPGSFTRVLHPRSGRHGTALLPPPTTRRCLRRARTDRSGHGRGTVPRGCALVTPCATFKMGLWAKR